MGRSFLTEKLIEKPKMAQEKDNNNEINISQEKKIFLNHNMVVIY